MSPLIPSAVDLIVALLFFYKDGFSIKWPMKVDIPLNKKSKQKKKKLIPYPNYGLNSTSTVLLQGWLRH